MRDIWKRLRSSSDRGTSLVEVVVAVFILGFVGLSLAGGLSSTNKIADKTAQVISANNTLQTAARIMKEDVQLIGCSQSNPNPYSSVASGLLPDNVTIYGDILAKYVYGNVNATFTPCSQLTNSQQDVQQITLRYYDSLAQVTQLVTVTKSIYDCADCISQQPVDFTVNLQDSGSSNFSTTGTIEVVAGDTKTVSTEVVGTNAPASWSPDLVWQVTSPKPGFITTAVTPDASDPTLANLSVGVALDTPAGTYQTTLRAFDMVSNTYSKLISKNVAITVYPAITLTGVTDNTDLDTMVGCGFTSSSSGATSSACGAGLGAQLVLGGGYGDEKIQPGTFGPFRIDNTGTLKVGTTTYTCTATKLCVSFDTTKTQTGGQNIDVVVAGSRLSSWPNAQTLKTVYQAKIRAQLDFGSSASPIKAICTSGSGTTPIGFLASTHDTYCTLVVNGGTGTGSKGSLTSYTAVSGVLTDYESSGKAPKPAYNSTTDVPSITFTVKARESSTSAILSSICTGTSSGSYSPATKVGTVKDARLTSVTIPVWVSVKC